MEGPTRGEKCGEGYVDVHSMYNVHVCTLQIDHQVPRKVPKSFKCIAFQHSTVTSTVFHTLEMFWVPETRGW